MPKVGERIKSIRNSREMSIDDVSALSGLKSKDIEKIENGNCVPSITPLIKISRAMGTRMETFLDDHKEVGPIVVKSGDNNKAIRFNKKENTGNNNLNFFSLAHNKAGRNMEPFMINVDPSSQKENKLSSHEGEEFIFVIKGSIIINYGKETYSLNQGDSIYYDSIVDHQLNTAGNESATILSVIYTPA